MLPLVIKGANAFLGKDQKEYTTLPVRREEIQGHPCMTSLWEPSVAELQLLLAGGAIKLTILGSVHPPVMLKVQAAPE